MRSTNLPSRRLAMESLEPRLPLAGNVIASAVGGDLILKGDGNLVGNLVEVVETFSTNNYVVRGLNGTTINNGVSVTFPGIARDIKATFGNGNDFLRITGSFRTAAIRDVVATMGAGSDFFEFTNESARNITVNQTSKVGFGDDDNVLIRAGTSFPGRIEGSITLNNAAGTDTAVLFVGVQKNITTNRTDGLQNFVLQESNVGGSVTINNKAPVSRPGTSQASTTSFPVGNNNLKSFVGQGVNLNLGSGLHEVIASGLTVGKTFAVRGTGNARVDVRSFGLIVGGDFTVSAQLAVVVIGDLGGAHTLVGGSTRLAATRGAVVNITRLNTGGALSIKSPSVTADIFSFSIGSMDVRATRQLALVVSTGNTKNSVTIVGSDGLDGVFLDSMQISGNTLIDLKGGDDFLVIGDDPAANFGVRFLGNVTLKSGTGRDTIKVAPRFARNTVTVFGAISVDFNVLGDPKEALVDIFFVNVVGRSFV